MKELQEAPAPGAGAFFYTRCPKCGEKIHVDNVAGCPKCAAQFTMPESRELRMYRGYAEDARYCLPVNSLSRCAECRRLIQGIPCKKCVKFGLIRFGACKLCCSTEPERYECCKKKLADETRFYTSGRYEKEVEDMDIPPEIKEFLLDSYRQTMSRIVPAAEIEAEAEHTGGPLF